MSEQYNDLRGLGRGEVLMLLIMFVFVLAVVPVACRTTQSRASRATCAQNLSVIGRAMMAYADDGDGRFPRSAGRESVWGGIIRDWRGFDRFDAYGLTPNGRRGGGSISSSFYLLVKQGRVPPRIFVCPGEPEVAEFRPADEGAADTELVELWDFGPNPMKHCSYAYHMPFGLYLLTTSSEPGMAVAADRSPWWSSYAVEPKDPSKFSPDGDREAIKAGNSSSHQHEGQNVLFVDGGVSFEDRSFCGVNKDNIYTYWDAGDIRRGGWPFLGCEPADQLDSLLVNDPIPHSGGPAPRKGRACFVGNTPVWIDGSLVQISEVFPGQTVGEHLGTMLTGCSGQVEQVQEHDGTFECRDIVLENGNRISVIGKHCFMLDSGRWIAAQHLTSGLRLRTQGGTIIIQSVKVRAMPYFEKVYNLKIKNSDMYFVGKDAVIVRDY